MPDSAEVPPGGTPPPGSGSLPPDSQPPSGSLPPDSLPPGSGPLPAASRPPGTLEPPALASPAGAATDWTAPDQDRRPPWPGGSRAEAPELADRAGGAAGIEGPDDRPRRGLRLAMTALGLVAAVVIAGAGVSLLQPGRTLTAGPPSARSDTGIATATGEVQGRQSAMAARAALLDLLDTRAAAVLARDKSAYLATIDPQARAFRSRQAAVFDSLAELPLQTFEYSVTVTDPFELSSKRRAALGPSAWTVEVALRYEIREYDNAKSRLRLYYTVVQRDGRWYIASDRDGSGAGRQSQVGLWDLGKINTVRGERSLVLGLGSTGRLSAFAAEADAAVPQVSGIWGSNWAGKVIVVVPDTQEQMEQLAEVEGGSYDQIAAVTRRETGRDSDESAGDRVIVNPDLWSQLGTFGRRVVMTHEITHVATHDATTSATPTWLSEGFADYVAYTGVPVSMSVAGQDLFGAIRRGRLPRALPTGADFEPTNERLAEVYESAWLACKLLADRYGQDELVRFYLSVGAADVDLDLDDAPLDPAFASAFDTTTAEFTSQWRAYLRSLAE